MTRDGETSSSGKAQPGAPGSDFDRRLGTARQRLAEEERALDAAAERGSAQADGSSLGQAFRLSSEFIAGIVAGGVIGWLADRFLGTSPWGLIVFFMLGFAAGIFNVLRTSGFLTTKTGSKVDDLESKKREP